MATEETTQNHGAPRRRIALFSGNYNYTVDGANKSLNRLVDHLERNTGAQVRVYSPTGPTAAFPPAGELISVPSIPLPMRPDYRLALGLPASIRRDIQAFKPDLIHLSAPDLLGAGALKLARRLGIPVVASVHTHFDSYLQYYALGWLTEFVHQRLQKFYRTCDFVFAPTDAIADELRLQILPARIRIWSRGVDPEAFSPHRRSEDWRKSHGFTGQQPVIVFMGRIVMEKGLAVFADAIALLEKTHGPVPVLVIGDGPARAWFEERLPNAVFTGFLSGEALATALASGDILLNPSHTETFGNVNLEAMASGLAMVCADAPNTRALLRHGQSALLCPPSDAAGFSQAIASLITDPAERLRLAQEALARSAAFRWPAILDSVAEVYEEAIAARAGSTNAKKRMETAVSPAPPTPDEVVSLITRSAANPPPADAVAGPDQDPPRDL